MTSYARTLVVDRVIPAVYVRSGPVVELSATVMPESARIAPTMLHVAAIVASLTVTHHTGTTPLAKFPV